MSVLLFQSDEDPIDQWLPELEKALPDMEIRTYPDIGNIEDIDYVLSWKPKPGFLATLPNLKLIHSIGAGVDHLLSDPNLPKSVPIVRMVDPYLRDQMSEAAILGVLWFHRQMDQYDRDRTTSHWHVRWPAYTPEVSVGVLGLGAIGADIAQKLKQIGFRVIGWSRRQKDLDGIETFAGPDGLERVLAQSNFLICVLPLTTETSGILNADTMGKLPQGAVVINLGRGGHLIEEDLLALLDQDHLSGAFLDVFQTEPLPQDSPIWSHPKIKMTPHVAGVLVPRSCASQVARNIARFEAGEALPDQLDLTTGY